MAEVIQLSAEPAGVIEDPVLDALSDEAEAEADLFAPMGGEEGGAAGEPQAEDPDRSYDLLLAPPTAVDLRRVLERLAGNQVPSLTGAFVGLPVPILLCHAMTPFAVPGERPAPIWAMGYQVELLGVEQARTVSLIPASQIATAASVSVSAGLSLDAGVDLACPPGAFGALLPLPGAHLKASGDGQVRLELPDFTVQAVKVTAGPAGPGGAMWQLYRHRDVLNVSQALLQVVALPAGLDQLTLRLRAWVSRRGWFGLKRENRTWRTPAQDVTVSLATLGDG